MKFMEIGFIQNGKWTQDNAVFADGHQKTSSLQDGQWHLDADPGDVWYESFAPSDRNSAYTTIPLATDDTPQMSPTPGMSDNGQAVSRFNLTFDCRLFLAVRTNYGNSQQYNPLGEAHWHFDGSGIIAANGTWTAINGRTGDYGDSVMGTTGFDSIVTDGTTCNVLLNGGSETWH